MRKYIPFHLSLLAWLAGACVGSWSCARLFGSRAARVETACNSIERPFTEAPCAFEVPVRASVRCGWLEVPEDRSRPRGRTIRLHVAIYKSRAAHPAPDPIVWLVGGPGGRAHTLSSKLFDRVVAPFLGRRDFIVVDVRGTGYSQPALDCPERSGDPSRWLPDCRERLSGIADLSKYNSAAVAADLAALRRALGIRKWNLFGESYGTRLALVAMRDFAHGIRSVVLDSVVPPEADEYADGPSKFDNALRALFEDCAANTRCNGAFPDLRGALLRAAAELDASPWRISGQWMGAPYDARLDGRTLLKALRMALYESDLVPLIPRAIYSALDRSDSAVWGRAVATDSIIGSSLVDIGAYFSYHCSEEVPFTNLPRLTSEDRSRLWMRQVAFAPGIRAACRAWLPEPARGIEAIPVRSRIPTLLLAGEYDPATPPAYAESAASYLANGHLFVFEGMGHWLTANTVTSCPQDLVLEFLDNPGRRPSNPCVNERRPDWKTG